MIELDLFLKGQLYGLEKFWAFLKYYKQSDKLEVHPQLKEWLKNYTKLEDFRVEVSLRVSLAFHSLLLACLLVFFENRIHFNFIQPPLDECDHGTVSRRHENIRKERHSSLSENLAGREMARGNTRRRWPSDSRSESISVSCRHGETATVHSYKSIRNTVTATTSQTKPDARLLPSRNIPTGTDRSNVCQNNDLSLGIPQVVQSSVCGESSTVPKEEAQWNCRTSSVQTNAHPDVPSTCKRSLEKSETQYCQSSTASPSLASPCNGLETHLAVSDN